MTTDGEKKRTDVGYGRPPVECRFKKGQKPPPRKKKVASSLSAADIFWKVLNEKQRVKLDGKVTWRSNAELIVRRANLEADKGSAILNRLLNESLLRSDAPENDDGMPEFRFEPVTPENPSGVETIIVRDEPSEDEYF